MLVELAPAVRRGEDADHDVGVGVGALEALLVAPRHADDVIVDGDDGHHLLRRIVEEFIHP